MADALQQGNSEAPPANQQRVSQAIVFGASGISGYALMKELTRYPTPTTFSRIIGLTHRPLKKEISLLPEDERLELYSDLDLLDRNKTLLQMQHIPGVEHTTHVYFAAYSGHGSSYEELKWTNAELLTNAVGTCEIVCPLMQFFTLQTGGKAYGVEFSDKVPYNPPLSESLPRIPEPYASNIFYYEQYDIMTRASAGKPWTFCEIRPDAIVGFVPQNNAMNIAQALGLFLSLWKDVNGEGSEVVFPGNEKAWEALHTDTSQDILARFHIFASLKPEMTSEKTFNVVDGPATHWKEVWPQVCAYFGLRGVAPQSGDREPFSAQRWMEEQHGNWAKWVQKYGLKEGALEGTTWKFMQDVIGIPFRRDYDASASRSIGFTEERPHAEGYLMVFEEMRRARIIP
ncbi:hypothetical protein BAUCODRAFT_367934 [Baudoinia panamericana UAMH 10762]|uniref:PRISE-like Rossmann-fold domain-containing protein n=1 Tax=Baudoinia panamericana (strain UAMH 10762) TaxID=717646 RepID=M2MTF8_BAUPA|nr:uncharacterized protein BAUCODRAFT_367934 [Baudoinia panamericana UAMH 10762]EMD00187.1 hypothetical protein BAUCODRAFT_367934 [Baudoinia panamericana UAMH 10762]